jgi:toxin ParE1/3/4
MLNKIEYSFHPDARIEFLEAIEYYENQHKGLGLEFAKEIYATIQLILHFPLAWSPSSKNTRRCLTHRFPYGIIYSVDESILILAVMHLNRKPAYWYKRHKKGL